MRRSAAPALLAATVLPLTGFISAQNASAATTTPMVVQARADLYQNVGAAMSVYVNGAKVGNTTVSSTTWVNYTFQVPSATNIATSRIDVFFSNDSAGAVNGVNQDRNLYVNTIKVNGKSATAAAAKVDKGDTLALATNGLDVLAGQSVLPWNAALRWNAPNARVAGTAKPVAPGRHATATPTPTPSPSTAAPTPSTPTSSTSAPSTSAPTQSVAPATAGTFPAPGANEVFVYVAPSGNDSSAGTSASAPVATLDRARVAMEAAKAANPGKTYKVIVAGGTYVQTSTLQLTAADSNVQWVAASGATPVVSGATQLDAAGWHTVTDSTAKATIPASSIANVREYDLPTNVTLNGLQAAGFGVNGDGAGWSGLSVNNAPLTLARWPKSGYDKTASAISNTSSGFSFGFTDAAVGGWASTRNVWATGFWGWNWADATVPLTISGSTATSSVATPMGLNAGQRFYFRNVMAALTQPGEWVMDPTSRKLFMIPSGSTTSTTLSQLRTPLLQVSQASNVSISGLAFADSVGDAIDLDRTSNVALSKLQIRNVGGRGVNISGGTSSGVTASTLTNIGHAGVYITGGDRNTLTAGGLYATRNTISHTGQVQLTYTPGIEMFGDGNTADRNEIFDEPHTAILIHGSNQHVTRNNIHNVMTESSDSGAIYLGRDWTGVGNHIENNWIHDSLGVAGIGDANAIYLDDMQSGTTVSGNIVSNVNRGLLVGGGRNNTVTNNAFVNTSEASVFDDRGLNWDSSACSTSSGDLQRNLIAVPYTSAPWKAAAPWLQNILNDAPCTPKYNVVTGNDFVNSPAANIAAAMTANGTFSANTVTTQSAGFTSLAQVASLAGANSAITSIDTAAIGPNGK